MNRELKATITTATDLYGKISRAHENLMKLGAERVTIGATEARLQNLEKLWIKFDACNDVLLEHLDIVKDDPYLTEDVPALAEEAYLLNKGLMLDLKRTLEIRARAAAAPAAESASSAPRTTLPRIQLPSFTGKYEDWPAFRDIFQSLISQDKTTKPVEKLHYLKSCVKGEADLLIRNLSTTGANFERAWQTLSSYYENKRLLTRAYLANFLALQKMKTESAVDLRKIFHGIKTTVSSLESINRPVGRSDDLFVYLAVKLLDSRSRREWETLICEHNDPPSYETLELFLERRLHTLEAMCPAQSSASSSKVSGGSKTSRVHHVRKQDSKEGARGRCSCCQGDHFVMFCDEYKRKTGLERKQLVSDHTLCENCLGRHKTSECSPKKNCTACGGRHHSSLHDAFRDAESVKTSHVAHAESFSSSALLATARVRVLDCCGTWQPARALVDQGSEASLISERLVQRLRLSRSPTSVKVFGVGGKKTSVSRGKVTLTLQSWDGGPTLTVVALVLPNLTIYAGGCANQVCQWPHLQGIVLADPDFQAVDPVDILLGAEVYGTILDQGQCRFEEDLASWVRRFWEQEEPSRPQPLLSQEELECEEHFRRTHSRTAGGRYVVRLPVIEPLPDLSRTQRGATRSLQHMSKRFEKEDTFRCLYAEFMQQYLDLGHMRIAPVTSTNSSRRACYLPHHGVLREGSASTKLRVVFNGSSSLPNGDSLNRYLRTGPNLLPCLADILLRWRRHRYALATDVEKMYRQILVHEDDQSLQRILWRKEASEDVKEYWLTTVTYGLSCAPYLAIRTLHQLAEDEGGNHPQGAAALRSDVYMDDILTGAATMSEALSIRRQLTLLCRAGGFPLKKWSANHAQLLDDLPAEDLLQQDSRWWLPGESHATLGLRWQPCSDHFSVSTSGISLLSFSKRSVLSLTAKLFDPLGWLSPVTVLAKILIQSTWLLGIDWDTPLPDTQVSQWSRLQDELSRLEVINIPRWLGGDHPECSLEVHGFADASVRAYAAVVYLRTNARGISKVTLVAAKTKVAPLKQVSLPRLELSAATLLVRLVAQTRRHIGAEGAPLHLWSDSTVTLGWIRGHPSSWNTYVANRVSEIQTSLPEAHWHHVPGKDNPADCASRGLFPQELVDHPLWWQGPPWLLSEAGPWPALDENKLDSELPERRLRALAATIKEMEPEEPELLRRYSSLLRLLRITAWCFRWTRRRRALPPVNAPRETIAADELADAQRHWERVIQAIWFKEELRALRRGMQLPARSSLVKLNPFLDETGTLRVGGRLRHAQVPYDVKHAVILPDASRYSLLVIDAHHLRTLHGGTQLTLCSLRQEYWIPRGRRLVKRHIHRCVRCLRWRAATVQPLMGALPAPRVTPGRPFLHTGVDYAGPIWIRTAKGRGHKASKAFIVVLICLSSRAVHLDVASDYTADAFLAALRRFISRRGLCHSLYSDCGTNFVGADAQLKGLFSAATAEGQRVAAFTAQERIRWVFNPPAAPNFGGLWEAAVKSMKYHLRRVIGDATLTYEEMVTLLAQIEACLNSRPLQPLSDDPEDFDALTPGHLLVGSALNAIPAPTLDDLPGNRLSRWQQLQQMRDHFWLRWSKEYLNTLSHRPKWSRAGKEVRVGQLCLLRCEVTPPTKWPLARIVRLHPGSDGHIRVVEIRTATSLLTRPVNKLIFLADGDDPAIR